MAARRKTKHILVTGFPNFTSIKLVQRVTKVERSSVLHVLVMEKYIDYAKQLRSTLTKNAQKQVKFYTGDVTSIDLGLSGKEFGALAKKITHIYHLAAIWDYGVPREICHKVNLNGTRNLLELARECEQLERMAHFSTINISGTRRGVIHEDEFWMNQKFKNHSEASRYAAERLVRKRMERGLPVTVFRLGNVIGESETGEIIKFEGPSIFLKLVLSSDKSLPIFLPGDCEGPSNLVPVDFVVNACQYILQLEESVGQTYHITDPFPLAVRSVLVAVCSYMGRKPPTFGIPKKIYNAVFLIPGMERFAGMPKELFDYFNHKAVHNCSNTLDALKGSGISCPHFETYLPVAMEYARGFIKRSEDKREEAQTVDPFDGYWT